MMNGKLSIVFLSQVCWVKDQHIQAYCIFRIGIDQIRKLNLKKMAKKPRKYMRIIIIKNIIKI